MSLKTQDSNFESRDQYATVVCTSEVVFYVCLIDANNGSLTNNPVVFETPEQVETSSGDSDDLVESLVSSDVSDDDISEFLVFHKKDKMPQLESDPKLKNGCFIKLRKCEILKTLDITFEDKKSRKRKRRSTNRAKKVKRRNEDTSGSNFQFSNQTTSRTTLSSTKYHKETSVIPPMNKHLTSSTMPIDNVKNQKIILKFTRQKKGSKEFQCQLLTNQYPMKNCSVVIERLPTLNLSTPLHCDERYRCKMEFNTTSTSGCSHLDTKIGRPDETMKNGTSPSNDNEPLFFPAAETSFDQLQSTSTDLDNKEPEASLSLSSLAGTNDFHPTPVTDAMNENRTIRFSDADKIVQAVSHGIPCPNKEESGPQDKCMEAIDKVSNQIVTETATILIETDPDDDTDDNSSLVSIYAPSMSDMFNSPNRDDSVDETKNLTNGHEESKSTKFRIPKLKRATEIQVDEADNLTAEEQVERIFAKTIRNSPKMLSPIKDLDVSLREMKERNKNLLQSSANNINADSVGTSSGKPSNSAKRFKIEEPSQSKDLRENNFRMGTKCNPTRATITALAGASMPQPLQQNQNYSLPIMRQPQFQLDSDEKKRYTTFSLFEHPCMAYISGKLCTGCSYKHALPGIVTIYKKMKAFPDDKIQFIYETFIARNRLAFCKYFPLVCQMYRIRKMKQHFPSLIRDCEKYGKEDFINFALKGLMECGDS